MTDETSFEYERRFYLSELPEFVREHGNRALIVQGYVFADDGYAIRIRAHFHNTAAEFDRFDPLADQLGAYERRVLVEHMEKASAQAQHPSAPPQASAPLEASWKLTVKSPPVQAERYEKEMEIDSGVGMQILSRCPSLVVKNRYSVWLGEDGWEFDEFGGQNAGLILAECERLSPVVGLTIPDFCETEVSDDLRFTNDHLSRNPWAGWGHQFQAELDARGPRFLDLR